MIPSKTYNKPWIDEYNTLYKNYKSGGKWILFYKMENIDKMWETVKYLYNNGKLIGVYSIRVSTNFRYDNNSGVIMCYCGPPDDRENVLTYGKNIVNLLNYNSNSGYIYYKTDTYNQGFRKSLYKIKVNRNYENDDIKPFNEEKVIVNLHNNITPSNYIFFDTETTGSYGPDNLIIQLAYIIVNKDFEIVKIINKYLKHNKCKISKDAYNVHKINKEILDLHGHKTEDILSEFIKDMVDVKYVVGHNVKFDINMIQHNLKRYNYEIINPFINKNELCTCLLGKYICCAKNSAGKIKLPKLDELHIKLFGKSLINSHDALVDTIACMKCFIKINNITINKFTQIINNCILMQEFSLNKINKITNIYKSII